MASPYNPPMTDSAPLFPSRPPALEPIDEWCSRAQFADFGGYRLAWWDDPAPAPADDARPPLVLIHGFPTSSWDWTAIWPALSRHFSVMAMDMLGFGLSDKPRGHRYSIMEQADLLEAFLERNNISEAHILAHDYGDTVAQELLARQNDRSLSFAIKSIVFLNGGLFAEMHRPLLIQKIGTSPMGGLIQHFISRDRLRASLDRISGAGSKPSDDAINGHWALIKENNGPASLHRLLRYIPERRQHRTRWVGALSETTIRMRLIVGGSDPVSGIHLYHHYKEQVRNADAVLLSEIGHYPQIEAPREVIDAVFDFHRLPPLTTG